MAIKAKSQSRWWSRFHFLFRFFGLLGLVCAGVGWARTYLKGVLGRVVQPEPQAAWVYVRSTVTDGGGDLTTRVAVAALAGGAALAVLGLVVELLSMLTRVTGRRSAFGLNAAVQVGLAAALLVGINYFS